MFLKQYSRMFITILVGLMVTTTARASISESIQDTDPDQDIYIGLQAQKTSVLYRGRNEQLMIPRPVGESNLIPYFRMLTSMLDIYEARDDTDENRMVDMRPVLDALVDDTCKMLVNLVGCQLECKTYSDMLKTIKLYLELFYTAENGSIAMRKYKAKSNELEANCTDSL